MEKHIDAIGFLLAALAFSVGFLASRIHTNLDTTVQTVREQSWRVRTTITGGGQLGPTDLADVIGMVNRDRDVVAIGSRVLNFAIFFATFVVMADALLLLREGVEAPDNQMLLISVQFFGSCALMLFSEFDVRRVAAEHRREVSATTLGRLRTLAEDIARDDVESAAQQIAGLRQIFPEWGFLVELEAYVEFKRGNTSHALELIEMHLERKGDLYVAPVVGAACKLEESTIESALQLMDRIAILDPSTPDLETMRRALAIASGHLPELLMQPSTDSFGEANKLGDISTRRKAQALASDALERSGFGNQHADVLALDLRPEALPPTSEVSRALENWENHARVEDFEKFSDLHRIIKIALSEEDDESISLTFDTHGAHIGDPLTLESFGLICLANGEPREALKFLESAIRYAPAAARSHWGRAIACEQVGWRDAASESLRRVNSLSDDTTLLSITQQRLDGLVLQQNREAVLRSFPRSLTAMDRFELALLGLDVYDNTGDSLREQFAAGLITLATRKALY